MPMLYVYTCDLGIALYPLAILMLVFILFRRWKQTFNLPHIFFLALFSIYLIYGIDKVFFPIELCPGFSEEIMQLPFTSFVNLIPFYFGQFGLGERGLLFLFYNTILTMPFGFGINFLTSMSSKKMVRVSIFLGLGLEVAQFLISIILRYPYRVVDINDSIFNACGVLLGYGLFKLFARIYLLVIKPEASNKGKLRHYLNEVVRQKIHFNTYSNKQ
jgi:glycopeptide antibiotics resistance protein